MKKIQLAWLLFSFSISIQFTRHLIFGIGSINFIYLFTGFLSLILMILALYIMYKVYVENKRTSGNLSGEKI